ncbi:putative exocyst complex component Exo70, cullin repeat-like-containing domain-containing protein [Rosa chinensis]|uniref:Exocyst subunit Exo70 family protein n=1 Tax=Rosa chinensis TaxID=74649 RepID=A0A2P6RAB6_ROSCH|nr:exocyst complex component EXO70H1 [Rosa chinensis]PRQ43378.1 putative exocyst complex component Exo70, cullin repeat-like-containing domain-containing protein [Rosa chinensis]
MPTKGMRSLLFHHKAPSFSRHSSPSRSSISFPTPRRNPSAGLNFSDAMIEEVIGNAAVLVIKWDPEASGYAKVTSMFYESKTEAHQFIKSVNDLQKVMHYLVAEDPTSEKLVHGHSLMQIAMKRLQKEFYQILSTNRAHLDPESVSTRSRSSRVSVSTSDDEIDDGALTDEDVRFAGESISDVEQVSFVAMADLKSIAECMISSGYAKECVHIYKIIRKSIIDEGMYKLGVEKFASSRIHKVDKEVLDLRIKNWLNAVKVATTTLFNGEKILCDTVFAVSNSIRESCFSHIAKEAATLLFSFPQILVAKSKNFSSEDNIFRLLDMYTAISENWPEIDSIFSFESTASVRSQALNSLIKIGESVRSLLSDFESSIQKESSKSPVPGGGVHSLTLRVMNYLSMLTDYSNVLADIFVDCPPPAKGLLPEFEIPQAEESSAPPICHHIAWIVLILICKLDGKAKHYKDVSLSYLFLANNLQHVISKVRTSNLQYLLGEQWITKYEAKVRQFAVNYERVAWGKVFSTLPENLTEEIPPDEARLIFRNFNFALDEAYKKQKSCVVPDEKLREELRESLTKALVSVYKEFHDTHRVSIGSARNLALYVRLTPEDVAHYLSDLFSGTTESVSSSSRRRSG